MIASWTTRALAALVTTTLLVELGFAQHHPDDFRRSMGNLRPSHRTAAAATQGSPPPYTFENHRSSHSCVYRPYYPAYNSGYAWYPYSSWNYYGYPSYPSHYWQYGYSTPWVYPVQGVAVNRFLGVNQLVVPQGQIGGNQAAANANQPAVAPLAANRQPNAQPVLHIANRAGKARARRYVSYGDAHFRNGKFSEANLRYRNAAKADAALADAHFRQGYALMALGRYEPAARAIEEGLVLNPDWAQSGFHNDDLYGPNIEAKTKHIDALATAAADAPDDPVLQFLFGVCLYFDDQPAQAKPFFEHSARLSGNGTHLIGFLREEQQAPPEPAPQ